MRIQFTPEMEEQRKRHPDAGRFSELIWINFFHSELDTETDTFYMNTPLPDLQMNRSQQDLSQDPDLQLRIWLAILIGHPNSTSQELHQTAIKFKISPLTIATGFLLVDCFNKLNAIITRNREFLSPSMLEAILQRVNLLKMVAPSPETIRMTEDIFILAAHLGYDQTLDLLLQSTSNHTECKALIMSDDYLAFAYAITHGYYKSILVIMRAAIALDETEGRIPEAMAIAADDDDDDPRQLSSAVGCKQQIVSSMLRTCRPDIETVIAKVIKESAKADYLSILNYIFTSPHCIPYITHIATAQFVNLRTIKIDTETKGDALIAYFLIKYHIARHPKQDIPIEVIRGFNWLLSFPGVSKLLSQVVTPGMPANELIVFADNVGSKTTVDIISRKLFADAKSNASSIALFFKSEEPISIRSKSRSLQLAANTQPTAMIMPDQAILGITASTRSTSAAAVAPRNQVDSKQSIGQKPLLLPHPPSRFFPPFLSGSRATSAPTKSKSTTKAAAELILPPIKLSSSGLPVTEDSKPPMRPRQ